MEVKALRIEARSQYAEFSQPFKGVVELEGTNGKQEVRLSDASISAIFSIIKEQVSATAKNNAKSTRDAVQSASDAPLLIESSKMEIESA